MYGGDCPYYCSLLDYSSCSVAIRRRTAAKPARAGTPNLATADPVVPAAGADEPLSLPALPTPAVAELFVLVILPAGRVTLILDQGVPLAAVMSEMASVPFGVSWSSSVVDAA